MRWTFFVILKDYCLNCSLAGIRYLADTKYHITEKLFWFVCLLISLTGCYHMIEDELEILNNGAVNLVIENIEPDENSIFPSIGVCEMGNTKDTYEKLEDIINNLTPDGEDYAFDVEDFLFRVIFHNLYNFGSVVSYCEPHRNCKDCAKCPNGNYSMYTELVRAPCHQLLQTCIWNKIEFDCCDYFKPLQTSLGKCFLLNSIQIVEKNGPHWLPLLLTKEIGGGKLELEFSKPASVFIINEEEIPHMLLTRLQINLQHEGSLIHIYLGLQNIINYPNVRTVKPDARKCYFPNEQQNSLYKYYSYSTCVTECLKYAQIKTCNCTHHNMIYNKSDPSMSCNYEGLLCLDVADLIFPQTTIMQPWRTNGLVCNCLPSCNDNEINIIGHYHQIVNTNQRKIIIESLSVPSQRYIRQAARGILDLVVSVGGILGLFLGASILSGVELIYFFTIRWIGTMWMNKHKNRKRSKPQRKFKMQQLHQNEEPFKYYYLR